MGLFLDKYKIKEEKPLGSQFGGGWDLPSLKPKEEEEEEPFSFLNKYKFTPIEPTTTTPVEGEGSIAGGATLTMLPSQKKIYSLSLKEDYERKTLEQAGVSQRMRGIGEPPKEYSLEGITTELSEANKKRNSLWWNELKTTEDKLKFIKQENWSPELKQAELEVQKLSGEASKLGVNMNDWIQYGVYATFFAGMAASILPIVSQLPAEALNKIAYKVEGKTVKGQQLQAILKRVAYPEIVKPSIFDKKVYAKFIEEGGVKSIAERMKGITITEAVPRFAFGAKLYGGFPADEMVKALVETGKISAETIKELAISSPEKVIQIMDTLSKTSPVIFSKLKPDLEKLIPQKTLTGKAYRAETGILERGEVVLKQFETAQEKLDFDAKTFGNIVIKEKVEGIAKEIGVDLSKVASEDIIWVTKDLKTAQKYGEAKEITIPEDTTILMEDDEGGSLILKNADKYREPVTVSLEEEGKVEALWAGEKIGKPITEKVAEIAPAPEVKPEIELATPAQINKAYSIAKSKAMVSEEGKLKPQYRQIAEAMTGKRYIEKMTPEEAEMFIDSLNRLPEPKYRNGKLVAPSIPRTTKLTTEGFFQKKYGEPTPIWLLTDQTYYAEKLGIKPLVAPFEKGKQEFDLEFRKSSNLVDRMVNKLNTIAKTPGWERVKSKVKNIPTKAEGKMAELLNKHEATPPGLSQNEEDVFKYFRNLSKDIWRRENEVREKLDLPPIKYKQAYFRHTADAMAKEMLEGKYPFPQGIKYWSEKMVGKKIFNPMEFHRKLSDDLIDLWSKDIRAVTKAMLWNGLKEIHLAEPAKFLNEQLNAISKDLPEYKNLTPREQAAYDQTRVMPASTKKWLINYINQVIKGQETEVDASLNRIVTKSGLKGIFDKVLSPFGRSVGRTPITHLFSLSGRMIISGTMGWVPRQIIRNAFQQVQNLALYGVNSTLKSLLPASIDKNLKGLLSESLFLKSYTGFEELPTNLMGKLEKVWLGPYGIVAVNNAKQGMKAAYWNILELIKNPKFKKYGWADPQRTKDTPKGFLYPSEKEKLLKEMEFGSSCTQYQYIPMGMPGVFRYKALIPLTRLQSWWMNYGTKFNTEAFYRLRKGETSYGAKLPWSRRVNWAKYLIIGGAILTTLGYRKSFMVGVLPAYLSPAGQLGIGLYNYAIATEDWQRKRALNQIYYSWKAFIPGSLAWRDFISVWNGEKDLEEILFYGKKEEEKEKKKVPSPYLEKYKEITKPTVSSYLKKYQ